MQLISPGNVNIDGAGYVTRSWFVRLPKGMVADDLKEPKIWRDVQTQMNKALRKHDVVYAVGFGEDFAVEARVVDATREAVVLGGMKIIKFLERLTPLFADETYRVVWTGTGFAVERIADGARMGETFGSEALAIRHLKELYPKPVGAA